MTSDSSSSTDLDLDEDESSFTVSTTESSTSEMTPCSSETSVLSDTLRENLISKEGSCCCVSTEELFTNAMDLPLTGWETKTTRPTTLEHFANSCISPKVSEKSLERNACKANSSSSNCRISKSPSPKVLINLGAASSSSSLHEYIHSTPAIQYRFHHHVGRDTDMGVYVEEYRNSYTYPSIEDKVKKQPSSGAVSVKPTLFVLDREPYGQPMYLKKIQDVNNRTRTDFPSSSKSVSRTPQRSSKNRELGIPRNCTMRQAEVIRNTLKAQVHSFKQNSKPIIENNAPREPVFVTEPPPSPPRYATASPIICSHVKPTKKATTAYGKSSRNGKPSSSLSGTILCPHSPQSSPKTDKSGHTPNRMKSQYHYSNRFKKAQFT